MVRSDGLKLSALALPTRAVKPDEIAAFERDGAVRLPGIIPCDWLTAATCAADEVVGNPGPRAHHYRTEGEPGLFFEESDLWRRLPFFRELVVASPLAEIAGMLLRSEAINFNFDQLFAKAPGTVKPTAWHQDRPYLPITGWQCCVLWMALDPVPRELSLEFLRGSHRWGSPFGFRDAPSSKPVMPVPDVDAYRDSFDIIGWSVQPGDIVAFHVNTIHGAAGGRNVPTWRRTVATRWTGDDVRFSAPELSSAHVAIADLPIGARLDSEDYPLVWSRRSA